MHLKQTVKVHSLDILVTRTITQFEDSKGISNNTVHRINLDICSQTNKNNYPQKATTKAYSQNN